MVNRNVHLRQIAAVLDIDIEQLRALNPSYRRDVVPGLTTPSPIRLQSADVVRFIDLQDSIYNYNSRELMSKRDEVAVDDTPTFVKSNKNRTRTTRNRRSATRSRATTVTVRRGDNLGAIAKRTGTSVKQLQRLNGIRGTSIRAGQKLRVK